MIKFILKGGLGNQMFQYAAVKSLANKHGCDFELDLSFMNMRPPIKDFTVREYELDLFGITPNLTSLTSNPLVEKYLSYGIQKVQFALGSRKHYVETDPYLFDASFYTLPDNAIIEGYFNNVKYFDGIEDDLKSEFDLDKFYDSSFDEIESKIMDTNSVSINIRRGDYTNSKHSGIYTYLDEDYYKKAMDYIKQNVENVHFFVFSYDDPAWFKETFALDESEFTMMGKNYVGEHFKTYLRLISLCKNNIISNSTFAFWGAYLNKNSEKLVVAPNQWAKIYADFEMPSGWFGIDVYNKT